MYEDLQAKFPGAMIGSALGDAIGETAFHFREKKALTDRIESVDVLRYTDDTAMALGLAESILETGGIDQEHLGNTFKRNFIREPWRGYASGPPTVFEAVETQGVSYARAARALFNGEGSLGNGAAMRIVPVGLFFHRSESLYERAAESAEVTHAHPVGKDGACVLALASALAVGLDPRETFPFNDYLSTLVDFSITPEITKKLLLIRELLESGAGPDVAAVKLGRSVAVDESMPFALYSFLKYPYSFEDCLFCAVLNGGDRDTLGAMACGVSGAFLGIDSIPGPWREKLENQKTIEKLAISLANSTKTE